MPSVYCRCRIDVRMLAKLALVVALLPLAASTCDYPVQVCNMLYQQMESALLKDSENLYRLRQAFFPHARAEPTVLRVAFGLRLYNVSSKLCEGAMNSNLDSLQLSKQFFWTSSAVFSALNPRILDLFLPEILYLATTLKHSYYNFLVNNVTLFLDIDSLSCLPSPNQTVDALMDLTTQVGFHGKSNDYIIIWLWERNTILPSSTFPKQHNSNNKGKQNISGFIKYMLQSMLLHNEQTFPCTVGGMLSLSCTALLNIFCDWETLIFSKEYPFPEPVAWLWLAKLK